MKLVNFFRWIFKWIFKKSIKIKPSIEELKILYDLNNKLNEVEIILDDLQYSRSQNFFWEPVDEKIYHEMWDLKDDLVIQIDTYKQYLSYTYNYKQF